MYSKLSGFADEITDDLTRQVKHVKSLGMSYIEMRGVDGNNLIFHNDEKVKSIKAYLDENGIKLSALGSPLGKIGIKDDFDKHFEDYKRAVEVAHMMDCKNIRMFSYYIPDGEDADKYKEEVFNRTGKFVDYAKKNDAVLLHENEKGIYGDNAKRCLNLMEEFYGDNFKCIFDFANFVQVKQDTLEAYEMLKKYIFYFHVKDALFVNGQVTPAGYGDGHVKEILTTELEKGFNGFLSLEPHLSDFAGFASLEKSGEGFEKYDKKLTGPESFSLAYEALEKLLKK